MQLVVWFDSPHTGSIIQLPILTSYCKAISASAAAGGCGKPATQNCVEVLPHSFTDVKTHYSLLDFVVPRKINQRALVQIYIRRNMNETSRQEDCSGIAFMVMGMELNSQGHLLSED
jgi:hypothetical protein